LFQSPGLPRSTWARGTFRGSKNTLNISKVVAIFAPVFRAISSVEPTSFLA
jgi:hypothetical protein